VVDQGHPVRLEFLLGATVERLLETGGVRHHLVAETAASRRASRRRRSGRRQRRRAPRGGPG
jgi:hypothetical protein